MSSTHTAQTLGKYIGLPVLVLNGEEKYSGRKTPLGFSFTGTLVEIKAPYYKGSFPMFVAVFIEKTKQLIGHVNPSDIYPILRLIETDNGSPSLKENAILLDTLLRDSTGAFSSVNSHTGYLSIHDFLPCQLWSDIFLEGVYEEVLKAVLKKEEINQ